jgi:hypothetical protein
MEFQVIVRNGVQFSCGPRERGLVLVQDVLADGSLSVGFLVPLYDWNLAEFVENWKHVKAMHDADVLADLREAQWTEQEDDRWEAFEGYLGVSR